MGKYPWEVTTQENVIGKVTNLRNVDNQSNFSLYLDVNETVLGGWGYNIHPEDEKRSKEV